MFWSTRTAFQTAARNLAAVSANQDLGVRQTYSEICIITMKIRCLLRSKKRVVGWVKLDEGDTKDAPERNRLLRLATRGLSEYDCAAYLHKGASTHEHTLDAQGKHPHVVS